MRGKELYAKILGIESPWRVTEVDPLRRSNRHCLPTLVARGMTPLAAIRTAPGNPLQEITVLEQIDFVMQGGRVVRQPESWGNERKT